MVVTSTYFYKAHLRSICEPLAIFLCRRVKAWTLIEWVDETKVFAQCWCCGSCGGMVVACFSGCSSIESVSWRPTTELSEWWCHFLLAHPFFPPPSICLARMRMLFRFSVPNYWNDDGVVCGGGGHLFLLSTSDEEGRAQYLIVIKGQCGSSAFRIMKNLQLCGVRTGRTPAMATWR